MVLVIVGVMKRWYLIKKINTIMKPKTPVIYAAKHVLIKLEITVMKMVKYRGPACKLCNLRYRQQNFIPILFHNSSGYDFNLLYSELLE